MRGEGGRFSCRLQNFQGRSSFFMQTYFVVLSVCEVVVVLGASLRFEEVGPPVPDSAHWSASSQRRSSVRPSTDTEAAGIFLFKK